MSVLIGIRREDKNKWERRTPLIPPDIAELQKAHGLSFLVQPSDIRVYRDEEYRSAGITVSEDLSSSSLVLAVKEVPVHLLQPRTVYVFFAHVAKGQPYNMPMLRRLMELGCSLVDYEKVTDDQKRRLIFFGRHAGYAGIIETLRGIGQRLSAEGIRTPLAEVRHAYQYPDLAAAKDHLQALGREIARSGLSPQIEQLVFGFAGYGNVSSGAQQVFECLQPLEVQVADLPSAAAKFPPSAAPLVKVVFHEEHMVERKDSSRPFQLSEYYEHPELYAGQFERHLPYLDVLVNAIYWEPRYPRLVTREWARKSYLAGARPRLRAIGDISCDIEGSIEFTLKVTEPDSPFFVYLPAENAVREGVEGHGPVVMAVDNLPCEIPRESSQYFSSVLRDMVPPLSRADWQEEFDRLDLPPYLKRALIVHRGKLTPSYAYLHKHLEAASLG
jgi:saccharopine dehydrogenase (NAD+, L-lysine-forming)